jgi:carbamoyl-phosphate synthase large subunit
MRIMMSAAASPVSPGIIRHLQLLGHTVIGHDSSPYIEKTIADRHIRSPKVMGGSYLRFLRNFEKSYDLYLPFLDEELRLFAIGGAPESCMRSPTETLLTFTNKWSQQVHLELRNLPVAPRADVIIKPTEGRGSTGIARVGTSSGFVVQQLLKGQEFTIDVLTDMEGKFLYAVPRERLAANGVSTIGRIKVDEGLIDLAKDVVSKFKFAGPINIQVIAEPDADYIIEVNPRLSGSCIFTVMAGWDILDATIRLHEGKPFIPPAKVEEITVRRTYIEERI